MDENKNIDRRWLAVLKMEQAGFIFIIMLLQNPTILRVVLFILLCCTIGHGYGQTNLLLNGNFEDINTCKEYNAECGVEAWFYLKDVKVQMVNNEPGTTGSNSFAIFYNWNAATNFSPVIGTILPCNLQSGKQYIFKGWITAKLNAKLLLKPGIAVGEHFYVPRRPFSKMINPQPIDALKPVPGTSFYEFEYNFIAGGNEQYLTFGTFISEDTVGTKSRMVGAQTVSLMLDNFSLTSIDALETNCSAYTLNRANIYQYDHRHKEMDYTLYGKGKLPVTLPGRKEENVTQNRMPPPPLQLPAKPDTLKLGDVLFDFNKAALKANATAMLEAYFTNSADKRTIDSIYIEGHTDSIGSDKSNIALSKQRSVSVMKWISNNKVVPANIITIYSFGKGRPVATNKTPAGRAQNRRVEVIVFRRND